MNTQQANRLLNVARALRDAHANRWLFDMGEYGARLEHFESWEVPQSEIEFIEKHNCGTPMCAMGHYAARKDLQRTFSLGESGNILQPNGEEYHSFTRAMRDHFGVSYTELDYLFGGEGCGNAQTPLEAARYIEDFVRRKGFDVSYAA